jgi:protein-tyrosine phosphatase
MKRIVFVCTGNLNRSPAAELIYNTKALRKNFPMATSAAVSEKSKGRITNKKMRDALDSAGYRYYNIRSKPIDRAMIDAHDMVIYMADVHRRKMVEKFGMDIIPKLRPITDFHEFMKGEDVPDPHFSKDPAAYRKVIDIIEECMPGIFCLNHL